MVPIRPDGQHRDPMAVPVRLRKVAEAVRQGIIANWVDDVNTPITPEVNNAGRTTPCARATLARADIGRHSFMRLQRIGRRSSA